jgi:hypothetical protein
MRDDSESPPDPRPPRSSTEAPAIDPAVLDLDHVFGVLDHPRRRYLLYALATKLVAWEQGVDETAVSEDDRDRTYASIYHAHVPKLVEYGVSRFDEPTERIGPSDNTAQVFAVLEGAGNALRPLTGTARRPGVLRPGGVTR